MTSQTYPEFAASFTQTEACYILPCPPAPDLVRTLAWRVSTEAKAVAISEPYWCFEERLWARLSCLPTLALAKPIVASRLGGLPETIQDGVHGYPVEPGSVQELTAALGRVLYDEGLRQRMAESIRQLTENSHSWSRIGAMTREVYEKTIHARGGR